MKTHHVSRDGMSRPALTDDAGDSIYHHPKILLNAAETAGVLGVSKAHLYRMHNAGRLPLPMRLGGAVRWRIAELRAWVAAGMPCRERWEAIKATAGKGGGR